jgi:hypothetical protein
MVMRRFKPILNSLIVVISFCILVLPVDLGCCSFVEVTLWSSDLNIENPDEEVLKDLRQAEFNIFVSCAFSIVLPPGTTWFKELQNSSPQIASFDQMISILRC